MAEPTTEQRLTRVEAEQAEARREREDHAAWSRRMETLTAEVWELHRETQKEILETQKVLAETARDQHESDRILRETQEVLAETARDQHESDRILRETQEVLAETARGQQETDRIVRESRQENDRMMKDLRKEMAALGQKFGGFAEGMALPSMERCLAERFGTTGFMARVRKRLGDRELELDALAYADGDADGACVVEVKSRLRDDGIDQLLRALAAFPHFFPEHRGKKLLGVLAAVDAPEELRQRVVREGLVPATIRDDVFELQVPEGFEPRAFPNDSAGAAAPGGGPGGASWRRRATSARTQ